MVPEQRLLKWKQPFRLFIVSHFPATPEPPAASRAAPPASRTETLTLIEMFNAAVSF